VTGHNAHVSQVSTDQPTERRRGRPRWATRSPGWLALYRFLIAFFGGLVLVVGIVLVPYPGPGWLIVFGGLAILSSEFRWAKVVLTFLRRRYDAWRAWIRHRHWTIRLVVYLFGAAMVVATLWVLNAFALVSGWVGIDRPWLHSPFFG
jgi:uncharacterized protein (TIGR02611 family)